MYYPNYKIKLVQGGEKFGTGWLPPFPDLRDYTESQEEISKMLNLMGMKRGMKSKTQPDHVDLRQWCSEVEDQGELGSCTAHACVGIVEYFEKRAFGRHIDGSRLFIYKTTRDLMRVKGDTGAWLRNTMGALVLCGIPDEKYWPYSIKDFDVEPPSFVFAVANNFKAIKYFCHDPAGKSSDKGTILKSIKNYIANGIPCMFGFYGFPSFDASDVKGGIPFPCQSEYAEWGHAVAAVGYDDKIKVKNLKCNRTTVGALLIRNSWGTKWGDQGYGWLPYEYVLSGLASDFWSILSMEWVETRNFGL